MAATLATPTADPWDTHHPGAGTQWMRVASWEITQV